MDQKKQTQTGPKASSTPQNEKNVDMDELAQKIVALLLRELDIERERIGR
jgi:hypothetical protein